MLEIIHFIVGSAIYKYNHSLVYLLSVWNDVYFTDLKKAVVICEGGSSRDIDTVEKKLTNMHRLVTASRG